MRKLNFFMSDRFIGMTFIFTGTFKFADFGELDYLF